MSSVPLREELEQHLACSSCGLLISFGPVTKSSKGHYQCGRCPLENGEQILIYETLASDFLFPCKNKNIGCDALLPFGEKVKIHEITCAKRSYKCPIVPKHKCDWEGTFYRIEEHFKAVHCGFVLQNLSLEVNLEEITKVRYAYFYKDTVFFLIDISFDKDVGLGVEIMRVLKYAAEQTPINEKHIMVLYHKDGKFTFSRNTSSYFLNNNSRKIANNNVIDVALVNYITTTNKKSVIEIDLELPASSLSCLEISSETICACKNRMYGCLFLDCFDEVQQHVNTCCVYRCPLGKKVCDWQGVMSSIQDHCIDGHKIPRGVSRVVSLNEILSSGETEFFKVFVPRYRRFIFRVCIKLENIQTGDSSMYITVQSIHEADMSQQYRYSCHLSIKSSKGQCSDFTLPFLPFTSDEDAFKNSTHFCLEHLEGSTLIFK